MPGDPGSGMPGSGTTPSGQPETLTVQHGNNTLTMTSPNSNGTMQLTVQGPDGKPHTYDVNFGTGTPGQPGQPGMPGTLNPTTSTTGAPGTVGASGPAIGADGAQQVTPGANGTAVIHDGSTTITAQQEPGGQVKVTVDDGSGQPTTYTLGQAAGTTPGAQPVGGTNPSGFVGGIGPQMPGGPVIDTPVSPLQQGIPATQTAGFTDPSAMGAPAAAPAPGGAPDLTPVGAVSPTAATPTMDVQPTQLTSAQVGGGIGAVGDASSQSGIGAALGGAVGGSQAAGQFTPPVHQGDPGPFVGQSGPGHPGLAGTNVTPLGQPGDAGLASAPPGALDHHEQGGMPMSGSGMGMGGMGGAQAGAEHHHKVPGQWRTHGRLFDDDRDDESIGRFSGRLLDDGR